uniref:Transcriptional activator protein n=1 Tax=Pepper leafroll virus TaxID=1387160 RepID=A0A3G2JTD9_9GEMI|nr:transactivator protein [Pepper leafroll virus]
MRNLSSSTPPCIKAQHRAAKRRAPRRRRIDLNCGCSIYVHIKCSNDGFTHRGTHHCASGREWRIYLGDRQSPLFQNNQRREASLHEDNNISRTNPVQPQPEESVGSPQGIPQFPSLDDIDDSFWADIFK